ncbi:hypothetical protein GJ744_005732 [Endocarpon pusillum]|uniref:Uncharacterized protein n=1 Tax=Endocarpon pusillum TaxID=364733 RepID=A0A8H7AMT9_9EURO|nr:hypothetical protein GJ744_005732 [Endocarpon pusillum]
MDCNDVPLNATIDCDDPWANGCTSKARFEFVSIWNFTYNIYARCPTDPRLFKHANGTHLQALTQPACEHIAGSWLNWYRGSVIWVRLTTWKFPLFQLIAHFARPPLGYATQAFVIAHLLGDPINTIQNLLHKLSKCQSRAEHLKTIEPLVIHDMRVKDEDKVEQAFFDGLKRDRWQKALGLLAESYDEWGKGDEPKDMLDNILRQVRKEQMDSKQRLQALILETADALAADRATKHLPIWIAIGFFIGTIIVATTRTMAAADDEVFSKTTFISVEMYGVAFASCYFWVIPAVFLGSIIGVSQTEEQIRRILRRFHEDLEDIGDLGQGKPSPNWLEGEDRERVFCEDRERVFRGGVYSWLPVDHHDKAEKLLSLDQTQPPLDQTQPLQGAHWIWKWWAYHTFGPVFIVALPSITGALLSGRIPPENWNCRVIGELGFFVVWLTSAQLDFILDYRITLSADEDHCINFGILGAIPWWPHQKRNKLFWIVYAKDVFCTLATLLFLILAVSGCLNACSCWMDPETGLILPQRPDIDGLLRYRLHHEYPAYIYVGLGMELVVVPLVVWWNYTDALRVYVQRDDGESNWRDYWKIRNSLSRGWSKLLRVLKVGNDGDASPVALGPLPEDSQSLLQAGGTS